MKGNIDAARRAGERLPGIQFEFYQKGDMLVAQIPLRYSDIDLILTAREMETSDTGLDVVQAAWSYHVPAFVCFYGYTHACKIKLRVTPSISGFNLPNGMTKNNPDTWYQILQGVADDATRESISPLSSVLRARKCNVPVPDVFAGEQARSVVKWDLLWR
ncbi:MAG: hypothetical protein ABIG30_00205 [Candidatus Aenigmatarchaeota archaeon]